MKLMPGKIREMSDIIEQHRHLPREYERDGVERRRMQLRPAQAITGHRPADGIAQRGIDDGRPEYAARKYIGRVMQPQIYAWQQHDDDYVAQRQPSEATRQCENTGDEGDIDHRVIARKRAPAF